MTEDEVLQIIGSLLNLRGRGMRSQGWQTYGGVNNRADTLLSRSRLFITSIASQLPFGLLWAPYAVDWLVGDDFNKGVLHNTLSGLMAPSTGTYAGSYQNMWNKQTVSMLKVNRDAIKDRLRNDFVKNYYKITAGMNDRQAEAEMKKAGSLSLPRVLNYLIDPAANEKTLKNIKLAQAGVLSWSLRLDPLGHFGFGDTPNGRISLLKMTSIFGNKIEDMAKEANRRILLGFGNFNEGYGGFAGSLVSLLANILSNASQQIKPGTEQQVTTAVNDFQKKVKGLAQALSPLKDIFGHDVKAMTDMLQDITGQNISQLTPEMVRSLATNTADLSRYSGASPAQMAQAGRSLLQMSINMGGNSFSRIGASTLGGYYSALMAAGNAPAGVHAAEYAASTQRALVSAQASQGADWASMAYAIWTNEVNKGGSYQDFLDAVSKQRANGAPDMMTAIANVARVSSQLQLLRGKQYVQYRTALESGLMAKLGIELQYRTHLKDTIWGLKQRNSLFSAQFTKLEQYMSNPENAAAIQELVTNSKDPEVVKAFAKKAGLGSNGWRAVNLFLSSEGALLYTARYAGQQNIRQYQAAQKEIRDALAPLLDSNAGGMYTLFHALSQAQENVQFDKNTGTYKVKRGDKEVSLSATAYKFLMRGVLGTLNQELIKKRIENLKAIYGVDETANLLARASKKGAENPEFLKHVRRISLTKYDDITDPEKRKLWMNSYRLVTLTQLGMSTDLLKSKSARELENTALNKYRNLAEKETNSKKKEKLQLNLKSELENARRVLRSLQLTIEDVQGLTDEIKKAKLLSFQTLLKRHGGKLLTKLEFGEDSEFGGTYELYKAFHAKTASGYNLQNDVLRKLSTVLELLLSWFKGLKK